ncbi:RNA-directed DNA polymerase, eukaryota [Tanacetum coccineum]
MGARSFSDDTRVISKSVFVTNFPDGTSAKDLWMLCQGYGTVVDVFIPNRKSKAGKRFAFVRFIRVNNIERLIDNLCTLWIGRMHLHANVARFERPKNQPIRSVPPTKPMHPGPSSFVSILKGNNKPADISPSPAMILDDDCVVQRNLEHHVMGEVKCFSSIPNLYVLLSQEGFKNVKVVYLGGLWVMIDLKSSQTKKSFLQHVGVASWFLNLRNAQLDFVPRDRIVWVDVEGVPLHGWTSATFSKIGSKWGEVLDLEEGSDDMFARKRLCIKTSQEDNILDKFKIIIRGKVFIIRAKNYSLGLRCFKILRRLSIIRMMRSVKGSGGIKGDANIKSNLDANSDDEVVSDTCFGDNGDDLEHDIPTNDKESSPDPFNVYDLLQKQDERKNVVESDTSISHPPGFTQEKDVSQAEFQEVPGDNLSSRVFEEVQHSKEQSFSDDRNIDVSLNKGGSILDALDDMIKVGQIMGYDMDGCVKDMERIIGSQGVNEVLQ